MSELWEAIRSGDVEKVRALVSGDPSMLSLPTEGVTPVLLALYHGHPGVAKELVRLGAELSFPEMCATGDIEAVESALRREPAIVHARSGDGFPALGLAIFFRQPHIARRLTECGADVNAPAANPQRVTPLHAAAAVCDRETMHLLLARGADPNVRQQMDYTPLHGAASRGDVAMAELLLAHGADSSVRAADGASVGDVARKYGHDEFAEWFEKRIRS